MVEVLLRYHKIATRSIAEVLGLLPSENEGIDHTVAGKFKNPSSEVLSCKLFCSEEMGYRTT